MENLGSSRNRRMKITATRKVLPFFRQISRMAVSYRRLARLSRRTTQRTATMYSHWKPARVSFTGWWAFRPLAITSSPSRFSTFCSFSWSRM